MSRISGRFKRATLALFVSQALAMQMGAGYVHAETVTQSYSLTSGSLEQVLLSIARQSGKTISFDPSLANIPSSPVVGQYSVEEAIRQALRATKLSFRQSTEGVFTVVATPTPTTSAPHSTLDTVTVTGTRRSDATVLNSSAPVKVITAKEIQASSATDLNDALQKLVPSFNYPPTQTNARTSVKGASLRGLSPDQTLVLVNGKRRAANALPRTSSGTFHGSQAVDLSVIPLAAIERIDVLTDGASAQYGSDAIAGVVNVILKRERSGGAVDVNYGAFTEEWEQRKQINAWGGFELPNEGFLTLSAGLTDSEDTDRDPNPDLQRQYFAGDAREATADRYVAKNNGSPRYQRLSVLANAEMPLSDQAQAYGYVNYGKYLAKGWSAIRPNADNNVRALYPDGSRNSTEAENDDIATTFGVLYEDSTLGNFDLSLAYARSQQEQNVDGALNPTLGVDSPDSFRTGTRTNELLNLSLDYTRELNSPALAFLAKAPVVSAGIGYRREEYSLKAGETLSWLLGGQPILDGTKAGQSTPIGPGIRPDEAGDYGRNVWGGYLGIEGDITEKLKVGLTGRRESYSDFGLTDTGKLSVRYDFTPGFALRSSISTGYRAPGLGQIGFATSTAQPQTDGSILYTRTVPVGSPIANALGFPDLEPEKSKGVSAGFVWQPTSASYVTFDAYRIDIEDKLIPTDNISGPLVRQILNDSGYGATSVVRVFTNAADTSTKGFDLAGKSRFELGAFGKLDLSAGYNVNVTRVTKLQRAPGQLSELNVNTPVVTKLLEHQSPRSKIILGADWGLDDWRASVTAIRYGSVKHISLTNIEAQDYWLDPQWVVNTSVSYDVSRDLTLTLGANNVFNSYPDRSPWFGATSPPSWSMITPDGFDGRFVYTNLSYRF